MAHLPNPKEGHPDPEPVGSPRRVCIDGGGTWDAATKTCTFPDPREEVAPQQVPKGSQVFITTPEGKRVIQTPETLAAAQRDIDILGAGVGAKQLIKEQEAQRLIEIERERLTAEEVPVRRELSPDLVPAETLPVLGGIQGASRNFVLDLYKKAGIEFEDDEGNPLLLQPEQLRTAALTRIEQEEISRGLTASERFGSFIEGIPIAGGLVAKYASGLIETPSSNAREVVTNIRKEKRRLSNIETNVKLGYLPVPVAQEQITDIENNVQRLESRVKLLISESPQLKFNTDAVNTIETEILLTREKIFQAKQNVLEGALTDPDEIQLFLKLQSLSGETEE